MACGTAGAEMLPITLGEESDPDAGYALRSA
jgi:hypothetical protein